MDEATQVMELPLFPLKTVLFPGQVLPLHIFEPRYLTMIRRCLAEDAPFGVVLIRAGSETDPAAEPYEIGTMTRIVESTRLPDKTMNIITVGTERFRIRQLMRDLPYLRGEVETFPILVTPDAQALNRLSDRVRAGVTRYIELIAQAAGLQIEIGEVPETPQQVGYLAAVAMQIDNDEKQNLLGCESLYQILHAEVTLLNRENALLQWMTTTKEWPGQVQFGPSGTLLPN
jgi:Lon protease-like protein